MTRLTTGNILKQWIDTHAKRKKIVTMSNYGYRRVELEDIHDEQLYMLRSIFAKQVVIEEVKIATSMDQFNA